MIQSRLHIASFRIPRIGSFEIVSDLPRINFRIKAGNLTVYGMASYTETLEGITSLQEDGYHTPFFDFDDCDLDKAVNALKKLQTKYDLSDIYVTSDKDKSFRALCFCHVPFSDYLKMMLELIDKKLLDYNFFYWTVKQGKSTIRTSNKIGRENQNVVAVLESYFVPFPEIATGAIYDTGTSKKSITVFLGKGGKIK